MALRRALSTVVGDTFNMLSVDGDASTNDMACILANGMAGNPVIETCMGAEYEAFVAALYQVAASLCAQLARDGEGATKLMVCDVTGARTRRRRQGRGQNGCEKHAAQGRHLWRGRELGPRASTPRATRALSWT